jgi:hypothetical protein
VQHARQSFEAVSICRRAMPGTCAQDIQEGKHTCYRHDADTIQAKRFPENYQR